jgi:hypothetical protein
LDCANLLRVIRISIVCCFAVSIIVTISCNLPSTPTPERVEQSYLSDSHSVGFDVEPVHGSGSVQQWVATYASQGKTAKFRIELSTSRPLKGKESQDFDIDIQSGTGRFISEPEVRCDRPCRRLEESLGGQDPSNYGSKSK